MAARARKGPLPPSFKTFGEYLRRATIDPVLLEAPYTPVELRVIAYMDWLRERLAIRAADMNLRYPVSVVIPARNAEQTIVRALLSLISQTHSRLEVIVVDDASTDGTAEAVRGLRDDRIRVIEMNERVGQAGARMIGMQAATSSFVGHLDADDWWDPRFVAISLAEMVTRSIGFVYSAQRVIYPVNWKRGRGTTEAIKFAPFNRSLLENRNYIPMISVLHDRDLGLEVGFDTSLSRFVDWDFHLRLSEIAPPMAIPAILSTYDRGRPGSVTVVEDGPANLERLRSKIASPKLVELGLAVPDGLPIDAREKALSAYAAPNSGRVASAVPVTQASVVVPSFEVPAHLDLCLRSLRAFDDPVMREVIVVDNASSSATLEVLASHGDWEKLSVIRSDVNRGFTWAVNRGIEEADPNGDVVLLNNDTIVTPGWLMALAETAARYPGVGIVAPRQVLFPGTRTRVQHARYADPRFENDTNLSWHHASVFDPYFDPVEGVTELSFAPFFCVLLTRAALDACGTLSERGPHFLSDWLYCEAVRGFADLRILYTARSKVYHFLSRASEALRQRDPELFDAMVRRNARHDRVTVVETLVPPNADG